MLKINSIYNEDCMNGIKKIPTASVDLVIIDPPYQLNFSKRKNKDRDKLTSATCKIHEELISIHLTGGYNYNLLDELVRVMKRINIYIWCNKSQLQMYFDYFVKNLECNFEILVWNKTNPLPTYHNTYLSDKEYCLYFKKKGYCNPQNYEDARTVFLSSTNIKDKRKYGHPTIKPLDFIRKIIRNSSKENDVILDCFIGSGTTAVACIYEKRNYIGFEINKNYYDIAIKRIKEAKEENINKHSKERSHELE